MALIISSCKNDTHLKQDSVNPIDLRLEMTTSECVGEDALGAPCVSKCRGALPALTHCRLRLKPLDPSSILTLDSKTPIFVFEPTTCKMTSLVTLVFKVSVTELECPFMALTDLLEISAETHVVSCSRDDSTFKTLHIPSMVRKAVRTNGKRSFRVTISNNIRENHQLRVLIITSKH